MNKVDTKPTILEVTPKLLDEKAHASQFIETREKFYAFFFGLLGVCLSFAFAFGFGLATRFGLSAIPLLQPFKEYYTLEKGVYFCELDYCTKAPQGYQYDIFGNLIAVQSPD